MEVNCRLDGQLEQRRTVGHDRAPIVEHAPEVEHEPIASPAAVRSPLGMGPTTFGHEPMRTRKLLLHREEIRRLIGQTEQKGLTLVPLRLYFRRGLAKVELGLARGKRQYDRRREIAKRDAERAIDRALGARQ